MVRLAVRRFPIALLALLIVAGSPTGVLAQTLSELANYTGADRTARLIAGAKREGIVTFYSSATLADQSALLAAFQAKYGIKVQQWRGSSEDIRARALAEYAAGRFDADIAETSGSEMEPMVREGLLAPVATPATANLIPQAIMPHHAWVATRLSVFAGAYNTDIIKPKDVPRAYDDLRDPKWKGKLGIEADDANWFLSVVGQMGEEKGLRLFHQIVAQNGISVRKGHTLLANFVGSGEVPLALTTYSYRVEQMKREGAPVELLYLPPVVALPTGAGVFKKAPHPSAALLLLDFYLTDAQKILAGQDSVVTDPRVKPLPKDLIFVDLPKLLDEGDKWNKLFQDTFVNQVH
ncbi:MAG TPA: ABC transporter substrate-binding protein [Xanthobacteraceae bacterium]|jgi:iron(III) transport system substrate-binding protein|nr:ABC transporter substrate-binding protein [Xanthobacteraceae bacterium]